MRRALAFAAFLALAALPLPGSARPTYFDVLTSKYGYAPGHRLYACGVCHYNWEGTGARNPFGTTVEQELYLGKPIDQAIDDAVGLDPDDDGFTSLEELATHETLPGYSCANFFEAIGAPPDWHSFITPFVASCLEPKDVRLDPELVNLTVDAGSTASRTVTIFNNGTDDPIEILSYALAAGAPATLSVDGPDAPFTLEVGESEDLLLTFAPPGAVRAETSLQIESDDPDEPVLGVGVNATGRVLPPQKPADVRAACLRDVDKAQRRFSKSHLKEWGRCHGDEVAGFACDAGARDRKLGGASGKLHDAIGGPKDERCEGAKLKPREAGHPERCGGGCDAIALADFGDLADCLACRQEEETEAVLAAALGAAPPDVPEPVARDAARCAAQLLKALQKGVAKAQKLLGRCELENVTAAEPVDCEAALAAALARVRSDVDARLARCADTTGLAGCYAGPSGSPSCLGHVAVSVAADLVDAAFGLGE